MEIRNISNEDILDDEQWKSYCVDVIFKNYSIAAGYQLRNWSLDNGCRMFSSLKAKPPLCLQGVVTKVMIPTLMYLCTIELLCSSYRLNLETKRKRRAIFDENSNNYDSAVADILVNTDPIRLGYTDTSVIYSLLKYYFMPMPYFGTDILLAKAVFNLSENDYFTYDYYGSKNGQYKNEVSAIIGLAQNKVGWAKEWLDAHATGDEDVNASDLFYSNPEGMLLNCAKCGWLLESEYTFDLKTIGRNNDCKAQNHNELDEMSTDTLGAWLIADFFPNIINALNAKYLKHPNFLHIRQNVQEFINLNFYPAMFKSHEMPNQLLVNNELYILKPFKCGGWRKSYSLQWCDYCQGVGSFFDNAPSFVCRVDLEKRKILSAGHLACVATYQFFKSLFGCGDRFSLKYPQKFNYKMGSHNAELFCSFGSIESKTRFMLEFGIFPPIQPVVTITNMSFSGENYCYEEEVFADEVKWGKELRKRTLQAVFGL